MGLYLVHHVSLIFILLVKGSQAQQGGNSSGICGSPNPAFNSRFGTSRDVPNIGRWPWMVTLQRNGHFLCDASYVAQEFVLTDADCFEGFPTPINVTELTATFGRLVINGVNPNEVTMNVTAIRLSSLPGTNVALLKVIPPTLNDFIQPVCLDLEGRTLPVGLRCFAIGTTGVDTMELFKEQQVLKEFQPFNVDTCGDIDPDDICMTGLEVTKAKGGGPVMCKLDGSWVQVAVLTLKYVASIDVQPSLPGAFGFPGGFRPPVPNDISPPPGGFLPPGGPPIMILQTTSRFRSFLTALTQSFPTAKPEPTTRMPRVVATRTTPTMAVTPTPVSNANDIHLSLLPGLFLFVQLVLSVMQWF